MNPEKLAETSEGKTLHWLKQKAAEKNCVITGSVAVEENGKYYNRLFWVEASGNYKSYDKRHLFRMAKEDEHFTAGAEKITGIIHEWKIRPLICYDLRFPVWSRNVFKKTTTDDSNNPSAWEYDVLLYVANWPEIRNYPWKQLLIARAIENQCYVIGVNRIGKDGNDYDHSGDSLVINPKGEIISTTKAHAESVETLQLNKTELDEFRKTFPVGLDADTFELK
jgi:predicted amidohydrolase